MMSMRQLVATLLTAPFVVGLAGRADGGLIISGKTYNATATTETVIAPFNSTSGTGTTNPYHGLVLISVSGIGTSEGGTFGDAFYNRFSNPKHDPNNYQLVITKTNSVVVNNADDAFRHIVYDVDAGTEVTTPYTPAYRSDHTYQFVIDTATLPLTQNGAGVASSSILRFGVNDGNYGDNLGSYTAQVTQLEAQDVTAVPEPSTLISGGLAVLVGLGLGLRRLKGRAIA